ncbi:hypothetical protein QMZ05_12510 [Bradyrhizobium sp. INPA03-11B]|uniref:hypothetical protein n=1 Tax=Bradyrhizobium sp. INPA03-11B TaxID=418598 RepID=UPI00338FF910
MIFDHLRYLIDWFWEVMGGVPGNGYSYPVIPWTELESWSRQTRRDLLPKEARALSKLGVIYSNIMSEKPKTDGG